MQPSTAADQGLVYFLCYQSSHSTHDKENKSPLRPFERSFYWSLISKEQGAW